MESLFKLLDVVALTADVPKENLLRGHVGTIVEVLGPGTYLVEFCDADGKTYAMPTLRDDELLLLRYQPAA